MEGYRLQVKNPWQKAENVTFTYDLIRSLDEPVFEGDTTRLPFPVNNVVCLSTTHVALLDAIGQVQTISGISGSKYIFNNEIKRKLKNKEIVDVGFEEQLNYETLLALNPDVVFAYGINTQSLGYYQKLQEMGIPVVFIAEYLEKTPLGRTEWLKFTGAFFEKFKLSSTLFDKIEEEYHSLAAAVDTVMTKPVVMTGLPFRGTWYVTGGSTYLAHLIEDAGAQYLWEDMNENDVYPMQLENIFSRSNQADFWIHPGVAHSRKDIIAVDERMKDFNALQSNIMYNNNKRQLPEGGNDYFESGVVKPQVILKDLIHIFHPEKFPEHELYFYKEIK